MKIAGIQFACSEDKESNIEKALKIMDVALKEGARIICFQEMFDQYWFPKGRDKNAFLLADDRRNRIVSIFKKKAKAADAVVLLPVFEKYKSQFFNSCVVIDADGKIPGVYRKIHIPDIPLWEEKYYFSTGNKGLPVFNTRHGKLGIQISWDNLYPEGTRILALKGAEIVFSPTACAFKTQHIWQTVITGNAITNGLYIMRVNRVGSEDTLDFYGMSFCVNPEGELIGGPTGAVDSILLADIDFEYLKHIRREWPLMKERKPKFYKEIIKKL
jgi:N-carbamoylputrescine amidase